MSGHVVALCGGVGGAKLAHGLALALPPQDLTIVVNTGDDFRHLGLHVSPDLDSVMYALAGLSDPVRGWGCRDETWTFMGALARLGGESWFRLGDGDLATHVERSWRLAKGASLSAVTAHLCTALGIGPRVLPMSDDPVRTRVLTEAGWLDFQEYFVHRQCQPRVRDFMFAGVDTARPQPDLLVTLGRSDLRAIVICPSNPFVSIEPILAVAGVRSAVQRARAPVLAVTPIIGGKAIKGPAAKMLAELELDVSATAVARRYLGLIDGFVLDTVDGHVEPVPGVELFTAPTLMNNVADRLKLALEVLRIVDTLEVGGLHHGRAQWIERASRLDQKSP
jgi:LPPG:FO 2-phospho-L-lactate transferase